MMIYFTKLSFAPQAPINGSSLIFLPIAFINPIIHRTKYASQGNIPSIDITQLNVLLIWFTTIVKTVITIYIRMNAIHKAIACSV